MALQPAHAPSASARQIFPLVELPQPRVVPSTAPAHAAPRRLRAPDSHAAAWPPRPGSGTPASRVVVRRCWHSRLHWRVSCCRAPACAGGIGAQPRGWSATSWCSHRLLFSSRGSPYAGTSCAGRRLPFPSWAWPCTSTPCACRRSCGSVSMSSSWCRRVCSSSSWCLASASSLSRARRWSSAPWWRGAGSDEELLDAVAMQTLHSCVRSWRHAVRAPRVLVDPGAAPAVRRPLT
jgi:hypothetical protein